MLTEVMTGVYIEETFESLTKLRIIDLFLKMKKQTNGTVSKLTDDIRNLNANFKGLESDVQVRKKVNDVLVKKVSFLECQCWRNALHSRRESAEIIGMSSWILQSALDETVCKVLQHVWADICEKKLELYHHFNNKRWSDDSETSSRKDCE